MSTLRDERQAPEWKGFGVEVYGMPGIRAAIVELLVN